MRFSHFNSRQQGVALVLLASLLWSFAGLLMRLLHLDVWTIQLWRGLSTLVMLTAILLWTHGTGLLAEIRSLGKIDFLCAALGTIAMYSFVSAVAYTTVADVLVVYATLPFFAAIFGWLILREKVGARTMAGAILALIGVAIMVSGSVGEGRLLGDLLALSMTVGFGLQIVVLRRNPTRSVTMINAMSVILGSVISLFFAPLVIPTAYELTILTSLGMLTIGLGMLLFTMGARLIPSAEAGLLGLLEVVLAPLWVWLAFSEDPGKPALIGGALVLAAVIWQILGELTAKANPAKA